MKVMIFEIATSCQFFRYSSLALESSNFCKTLIAVWNFFKKLLSIIQLKFIYSFYSIALGSNSCIINVLSKCTRTALKCEENPAKN